MDNPLTALRRYASMAHPERLPNAIRFSYTDTSLTVFDAFPKSIFHFLILPRIVPGAELEASSLDSLRTLLLGDRTQARLCLEGLARDAAELRKTIEDEMIARYGFKWGIWTGFHAKQSMEHVHLHVISNDLCAKGMKDKKHYNSFHPKLGFFLPLEEVIDWFDSVDEYYMRMARLPESEYAPKLKEPLECWRPGCRKEFKQMPLLKKHLQEEFDKETKRETERIKQKEKQKAKLEEAREKKRKATEEAEGTPESKRQELTEEE